MSELGGLRRRALTVIRGNGSPEQLLASQPWPACLTAHPDWPLLEGAARKALGRHGDLPHWTAALSALPAVTPATVRLDDRVSVGGTIEAGESDRLETALATLHPWRKGPFELFGVHVDSEWRSDWKWARIAPALGALGGQRVLDVGGGNGYFGWRLLAAGAHEVLVVDPSALFFAQHLAVSRYVAPLVSGRLASLPVTFELLPALPFDLVLSMGVVYHRPDPQAHVRGLFAQVRPGGRVLLESLVVTGGADLAIGAQGRYARMRNVSTVPRLETLSAWLTGAGFRHVEVIDVTPTTPAEQRSTRWMTFESLADALDPGDPTRTVEGHPAPVRAALLAQRPAGGAAKLARP